MEPLEEVKHQIDMPMEDPIARIPRLANKLRTQWLVWTYPFASFGKGTWAHYSFQVKRSAAPYISIGRDVAFARDSRLEVLPGSGSNSPIIILEDGSGLQRRCVISARNRVHVMRDVIFGPSVLVTDCATNVEQYAQSADTGQEEQGGTIRIEEDCWIGFGAVIACGQGELVIGRHSVIGANALITRSVPPYSVVVGNPARIVKQYDPQKEKWVLGGVRRTKDTDSREPTLTQAMLR